MALLVLQRTMMTVTVREISRVDDQFTGANKSHDDELSDHLKGYASQHQFLRHTKELMEPGGAQ